MKPKIDFAFKEIMMNDKALKGFLSAVLNIQPEQIKKIIRKNTNMKKVHAEEKQAILDVRIVTAQSISPDDAAQELTEDFILKEIDIEIQLSYMAAWADRSVFYAAKMLTEQGEIDKKYSNFKKCICINILNFEYVKQSEHFHTVWHIREDTEHIKYTDVLEWHLIELPKLPQNTDGTDLYQWACFINAEEKGELEMIAKGNQYLESALETLEIISQDEKKRLAYTARQKALYDFNEQMSENYERGRMEERNALITKLKAKGMTTEQIKELLS